MCKQGFGGFIKALRRDHDLTPTEFYDHLGIGPEEELEYWAIDHEPTRTVLDSYIEELRSRRSHPETTVQPIRSRLKKYVQLYADVNETANLLDPLRDQTVRPAEIDRALAVFDVLDEVLGTPASKFKYLEDTRRFYGYLIDAGRAVYNPLDRMATHFGWDRPDWDNPALNRDDVTALYRAVGTNEERLLVLGLAGWGLRPAELCALRADQLVLTPEDDDQPDKTEIHDNAFLELHTCLGCRQDLYAETGAGDFAEDTTRERTSTGSYHRNCIRDLSIE